MKRYLLNSVFVFGAFLLVAGMIASPACAEDTVIKELHDALPDRIKQSGTLVIATDAHHPPNESFADDGKTVVGFEPDMWNRIAALLGLKVNVVSIDFGGLIPGVQAGRFDVAFESMSDSPDREQQVTFIDFAYASAALYTLASNETVTADPLSLCGMKGGVQAGTDFASSIHHLSDQCTAKGKTAIDVMEFSSDAATVMALYSQRVDFALNDRLAAKKMTQFSPRPLKIVDVGLPKFLVGAAVRHDDTALASALLATLQHMHADGSYKVIMDKWQIAPLALETPVLNLAGGAH